MARKPISAGELTERITIQGETRTPDGYGGYTVEWTDVATVWARVVPLRGREQIEAQQLGASQMYRVTIRNRAVDPAQRIMWRGRVLNIREAPEVGSRALYKEILAEGGVAV